MKAKMLSAAFLMAIAIGLSSGAAAQSGDYGDYALSEEVSEYTVTPTPDGDLGTDAGNVAFQFDNLQDETVTVEFINDGNVQTDVDVDVDSDGFGTGVIDTTDMTDVSIDQIAAYPDDSNATMVNDVSHYYNGDGTSEGDFNDNQEYTSFDAYDSEGEMIETSPFEVLNNILPWLIVLLMVTALLGKN